MAYQAVQAPRKPIEFNAPVKDTWSSVLTSEATEFITDLARTFSTRRRDLLNARRRRQIAVDQGATLDFLPETENLRKSAWTVAPIPGDLLDRRVEITGPVDRKMIINGLNSGANVFMADFEDANSPTWSNVMDGQRNLLDAVRRQITYTGPENKVYELVSKPATLFVRPRGWHLVEKHVVLDGEPVPASIFDFGLFFFHNAYELIKRGTAPYFYLPKLESRIEARLWNDIFVFSQERLRIPRGTIRATVLIETTPAAFEMDEILYELREHSAGLNCGRWDYIFSFIKRFRAHRQYVLPDRSEITMDRHFLNAYVELLIQTCHRRGIHAMGGMAAQIPIKSDPEANERALDKVRADKLREVLAGHDGTWVAHPALVPVAKHIFDEHMRGPNQIARKRSDVRTSARDLLTVPGGSVTEKGLRWNIDVGIHYVEAWLRGSGCVPIYNLMEDAATAEICRTQVWQWVKYRATLDGGRPVTADLVRQLVAHQSAEIHQKIGSTRFSEGRYELAAQILERMMTASELPDFLTLIAYEHLD
jgi:malate synthase